ncbi:DUF4214 domain-containing protein [Duganella sp. BuS-21]|uniref:DUF4214 domain-containing protein n=1 Tax=Duganella sp. BuS-21 TaxID=2943848 RepID=UPI0035A69F28
MATNTELVQQLYVAYFNRPADVDGLAYYVGILNAAADPVATAAVISADFAKATEYKDAYANLTAKQVINTIYHNIFGHEADIPGLNYWSSLYAAGTISLASIVTEVAAGAQGSDETAFNNKVTAAVEFSNTIALSADQQLAYAAHGEAAMTAARSYLTSVTDNASLAAALADVTTAAASVVASVSSTLTTGVDAKVGGAGNDVFNAVAIDATGAAATTLTAADTIDGLGGTNTVNITVDLLKNADIAGTFKNIQIFNIDNTSATAAAETAGDTSVDVSKLGSAVKQVWQIGQDADVTNLGVNTTAGYKSITTAQNLVVGAAATAASISVALKDVAEGSTVTATGTKLAGVTVAGNIVDTSGNGTTLNTIVAATAGKDVQAFTLNSGVATTLTVAQTGGSTKNVTTVDASASAGDITYVGTAKVVNIKGGAGDDTLTLSADTVVASTGVAAIGATLDAGAGDNTIDVDTANVGLTTTTGATSVTTGAGDDSITITTRSSGVLTVKMGAGDDTFTSAVAITADDVIDAGAGSDTLLLSLVGSNNIGAFSNFDAFDAVGLNGALDVDILTAKNTVTEFVTTGDLGGASTLLNIGTNVGYRVTGDAGTTNAMTLTQKAGGALTVTVDTHETGTTATADAGVSAAVIATNATALTADFSESFVGDVTNTGPLVDNIATLALRGNAATALTIKSEGGDNASNVLNYVDGTSGTGAGKLAAITVTGATALTLDFSLATATNSLATVDSSTATGGLTFDIADLKAGGTVKLGSGVDVITLTNVSTTATVSSLTTFEKATAAAVGADATAAADAIALADVVSIVGATVATNVGTVGTTDAVKNGVLTFAGAGPSTLALAVAAANTVVTTDDDTVVFKYLNDTYVFVQGGAAADTVVKLTGITGVTNFAEDGTTDHFFIV